MNFSFRASAAFDFGPGGTATIFGPRALRDDFGFAIVSCFGCLRGAWSKGTSHGVIGFPSDGASGEDLSLRRGPDRCEVESTEGHDHRDRGEGRDDATRPRVQSTA